MELIQVRFIVREFRAMFRFYRDVVGLSPQVDDDRGPYGNAATLDVFSNTPRRCSHK